MSLNKNRFRPHKCDNGPDKSYIQTSTRQTAAILITFSRWTRNSPQFVEYGSSTTYSQKPATCSYYEPVESSPHVYTASLRSLLILSLHLRPGLLVYRTELHVQSLLSVPPYAHIIALYEKGLWFSLCNFRKPTDDDDDLFTIPCHTTGDVMEQLQISLFHHHNYAVKWFACLQAELRVNTPTFNPSKNSGLKYSMLAPNSAPL